jgi:outer membrane protein
MKTLVVTPLLFCSAFCVANEPAAEKDWTDIFTEKRDAGGFLAVGALLKNEKKFNQPAGFRLSAELSAAYYMSNGLFFEYPGYANKFESQYSVGYNLANFGNWEFDLIASGMYGPARFSDGYWNHSSYKGLRAIGTVAGLDVMFIYGISPDWTGLNQARYSAAWLAKSWNLDNWHLFTSLGIQHRNTVISQGKGLYEDGTPQEIFKTNGGMNLIYKIGAKKPLTESWLVEGFVSYNQHASNHVNLAIKYVF